MTVDPHSSEGCWEGFVGKELALQVWGLEQRCWVRQHTPMILALGRWKRTTSEVCWPAAPVQFMSTRMVRNLSQKRTRFFMTCCPQTNTHIPHNPYTRLLTDMHTHSDVAVALRDSLSNVSAFHSCDKVTESNNWKRRNVYLGVTVSQRSIQGLLTSLPWAHARPR